MNVKEQNSKENKMRKRFETIFPTKKANFAGKNSKVSQSEGVRLFTLQNKSCK
jgi:hypothetical protein